ncbi:hypothetical protein ACP6PL_17790 [Dapis sp. BLCC M126]|uniref:hypothetical protein n=1 Tax=Dapis sp. BLCC M126 TaxID=3400189 RepID=UPI003CF00A52
MNQIRSPLGKSTNQSSFDSSIKQLLKALGGATVSIGATFSLFLTSAQAASFVTTFEIDTLNVTIVGSGEDADGDKVIEYTELSSPVSVMFDWGEGIVLTVWDFPNFSYSLETETFSGLTGLPIPLLSLPDLSDPSCIFISDPSRFNRANQL